MEKEKALLVKENSILEFFKDCSVVSRDRDRDYERDGQNPYYFFKKEIFIKKDYVKNKSILFELEDFGGGSRRKLVNRYIYDVRPYDDISDRLELVNFLVDVVQ